MKFKVDIQKHEGLNTNFMTILASEGDFTEKDTKNVSFEWHDNHKAQSEAIASALFALFRANPKEIRHG